MLHFTQFDLSSNEVQKADSCHLFLSMRQGILSIDIKNKKKQLVEFELTLDINYYSLRWTTQSIKKLSPAIG